MASLTKSSTCSSTIKVQSDVYPSQLMKGINTPDFEQYDGREAALQRSNYLDKMVGRMDEYISRYPSGLDAEIITKRAENKKRILEHFGAAPDDWDEWKWQFDHVFKDETGLEIIKKIGNYSAIGLFDKADSGYERFSHKRILNSVKNTVSILPCSGYISANSTESLCTFPSPERT